MIWHTNSTLIKTEAAPDHPYFLRAYEFMSSWLDGQTQLTLHTSGSTGTPKDIFIARSQLSSSALMTGAALDLPAGTKALVCLNVGYIAGVMMLVRGLELGWELSIIEPVSNPLIDMDWDVSFDFVSMVPLQLAACLANEKTKNHVNNLGEILLGGAPVDVSLQKQINELDVPVYQELWNDRNGFACRAQKTELPDKRRRLYGVTGY
jgi:O-succinylbenzoic acid--CoA ligase